jgi:transposase
MDRAAQLGTDRDARRLAWSERRPGPPPRLLADHFGRLERGWAKKLFRQRCTIEQCIGWLKECRRLGTRFEKLAVNFVAMIQVAFIERHPRVAFSDRA